MDLNPGVLWRLGYRNMTKQQTTAALQDIYETLELTVGRRIASALNRSQLQEFERLIDEGHEDGAIAWLEHTIPTYRAIVQDEYDRMLTRLEGALKTAHRSNRDQESDDAEV